MDAVMLLCQGLAWAGLGAMAAAVGLLVLLVVYMMMDEDDA